MTEFDREGDSTVLCVVRAGGARFGIEVRHTREILCGVTPQRVPLSPRSIAGLVSYRGEVLTIVDLKVMLGGEAGTADSCVLVMQDEMAGERFGLALDGVDGVVEMSERAYQPNPSTLDAGSGALFRGSYNTPQGVVIRLDAGRLTPHWIAGVEGVEKGRLE